MPSLLRCESCGSFAVTRQCPGCRSVLLRPTKLGVLATLLGSSAFAMTLMACYGCPDCVFDGDAGDDAKARDSAAARDPADASVGDARDAADAEAPSDAQDASDEG